MYETGIALSARTSVPPSARDRDAGDVSHHLVTEAPDGPNGSAGVTIVRAEHIAATARPDTQRDRDLVRLITPDPDPQGPASHPVLVEFQ